jgi:vancomycin resistance protein VanJ
VHSNAPSNSAATRRARWIQAQRAALRGPPAGMIFRYALKAVVPTLLLAVWVVGVLLRVLVQDRAAGTPAYFYYATPPPVLAGLAFGAGLWWVIVRPRLFALAPAILGVACLIWAYSTTWFHNRPAAPASGAQRVLFWNVAHGTFGWPRVVQEIRTHDPDIIGLVEAVADLDLASLTREEGRARRAAEAEHMREFWLKELPGYTPYVSPQGITLLTRGKLEQTTIDMLGGDNFTAFGYAVSGTIPTSAGTLHVVVVDVSMDFSRSLWPPLARLHEILEAIADEPVLVVGDFNTPADSVAVAQLRGPFANAFETAGSGYAATWPVPVPVLTIDQAWYSHRVQLSRCNLGWSLASDHRCIELEAAVVPSAGE